jgi:hypothetical protein
MHRNLKATVKSFGLFSQTEHEFHIPLISRTDHGIMTECTLLFGGFLGEDMVFERLIAHNFP